MYAKYPGQSYGGHSNTQSSMMQFTLITNVRILLYSLRIYFTGPYTMDREGNMKFSSKIRTAIYIINILIFVLLQYSFATFFLPQDVFTNAYTLLGYLRILIQTIASSSVTLWNIHFSEKASRAISTLTKVSNHFDISNRYAKRITGVVFAQTLFITITAILSVNYVCSKRGSDSGIILVFHLCRAYVDFSYFSAEVIFVNMMILLNIDAKILHREICDIIKTQDRAFDLVYIRDLIKPKDKSDKESKTDKINRIRVLYEKIYDVKEDVHQVFSFTLLVTTATTFGNMVFFVFLQTVQFRYGTEMTVKNFFISFLYPSIIFLKLSVIVTVCSRFKNKLKQAITASTKLLETVDDESEYNSVTGLVQELKHMDPDITCYRFTVIDYELVSSIFGTIITYTIILLQTKFTEDEKDPVTRLLFDF